MLVGIIDTVGTRRCAFGIAVPVVAAALRDDSTVTVYDPAQPAARWRLDRRGPLVTYRMPTPTLFDPNPELPGWVARLIQATTPLL